MAEKIDTVTARGRLHPRHGPYWHKIIKGCFVGYRKMTADSAGTWWARSRDETTGKQPEHALGALAEFPDHQRFDKATEAARGWLPGQRRQHRVNHHHGRVQSLRGTPAHHQAQGRVDALRPGQEGRQRRGDCRRCACGRRCRSAVQELRLGRCRAGRRHRQAHAGHAGQLAQTAAGHAHTRSGGNRGEPRTASTLNRDMSCLRAARIPAYVDGLVTSDFAWRGKLLPLGDEGPTGAASCTSTSSNAAASSKGSSQPCRVPARAFPATSAPRCPGRVDGRQLRQAARRAHYRQGQGRTRSKDEVAKGNRQFFEAAAKDKLPSTPCWGAPMAPPGTKMPGSGPSRPLQWPPSCPKAQRPIPYATRPSATWCTAGLTC